MDEIIDVLRVAWRDDPASYDGRFYSFSDMRVLPHPAHDIPILVGGGSEPAYRRAVTRGDGFHAIGLDPTEAAQVVQRIRQDRPEESFPVSLRTGWDPLGMDHDQIRRELHEFAAAGISEVISVPWRRDIAEYQKAVEKLAELLALSGGEAQS